TVGVHEPQVGDLAGHRDECPGVQAAPAYLRHDPQGDIAAQLLRYVREISKQELKHAPAGYEPGDKIGQTGVEAAYDGYLRGRPGLAKLRVDSLGNPHGQLKPTVDPYPGSAIRLTLDVRVQRAAEQALQKGMAIARASACYGCW